MTKTNILLIEDDAHLSKLVKYNLEKTGFTCTSADSAEDGLAFLKSGSVDLIILDIMLPKMDGFEFCKTLRQDPKSSRIPVIMLTAKSEEIDRIVGFELGADDYVAKPFSIRELILRIKAVLKRGEKDDEPKDILTFGELRVDIPRHRVTVAAQEIVLTYIEFKLLLTLLQRKGKVQSREKLLEDVWDMDADVTTRTIDTHIRHLRKKLENAAKGIETVRGLGYRFRDEDESE